ncbi:MAG: class I SAM-dependent methyltransferase [Ignavibacteriales bacterium]|nr:class I SAM-dependent methyltransferase [Ignavibacteriales bacterium]
MATKKEIIDSFESAYEGLSGWEIGRPQREIIDLELADSIHGRVLDVGCGTGENTLYLVKQGYEVIGVDIAVAAIDRARKKALNRGINALFLVHDALNLQQLGLKFDTVIDSGLFHVFSDSARLKYVVSIASVLRSGETLFMMCFSEHEPEGWGPRRITQKEILETFGEHFQIVNIRRAKFETNRSPNGVYAWLTIMTKR